MDFAPGLRLAQRWWPLIAAVTVLAGILAYAASYLVTPSYSSATRVLVRARDTRFLSSTAEDITTRPGAVESISPKSLNQTLAGLATSRVVAEEVVTELHLDQPRAEDTSLAGQARSQMKQWGRVLSAQLRYGYYAERPPFEDAVDRVQKSIEVTPIKDSYLMEIKVHADSPDLAPAMADAVTRAFTRQSINEFQRNAASYRSVLSDEVERARREVETAEAALKDYKEGRGITDINEAMRLSASDEDSLRQQLRDVESDLNSARARQAALERNLASLSPTERSTTSATVQNSTSTASTAEAGRGQTTTVNDTSTGSSEDRNTVSPSRVYQDVQKEALAAAAQVAGLEAKQAALNTAVADRARNNAELAASAARINQLELQRTAAHTTYSSNRVSYEAAVMNDARGAQEVSQFDAATRPLYPDQPLRYLYIMLGLLCGFAAGAGLALLVDRWSPSWTIATRRMPTASGAQAAIWNEEPSGAALIPVTVTASRPRRYEI